MNLKNKRITVVGLGKSGLAAARFLVRHGAKVWATDSSNKKEVLENSASLRKLGVETETGGHTAAFVEGSSLVVASPGVPKHSVPLTTAKKKRIPVISEVELAYHYCQGPITAITGSNGKTTTSHLIHAILKESGKKSVLCGNVGYSFLEAASGQIDKRTQVVLELSSFQLEDSPTFHPHIAAVLNISPNHLDRHGSMSAYVKAKERIFSNQTKSDFLILNAQDPRVRRMAKKTGSRVILFSKKPLAEGVYLDGPWIRFKMNGKERLKLSTANIRLKGGHNLENVLAAVAAAYLCGARADAIQRVIDSFKGLEHRIESVGRSRGISFVNDSKSTTLDSTRAAMLATKAPLVMIAGGRDKGADFAAIEPLFLARARVAVLYGEARDKIASGWKRFKNIRKVEDFRGAAKLAFKLAEEGDTVLLSPMCTSFDQFSSYEERGEAFKKIFKEIKRGK